MIKKRSSLFIPLCFIFLPHLFGQGFSDILPAPAAVTPWKIAGEPQFARGDDLYQLIDGGAELVIEYGFNQAILAEFRHPDGGRINLEIYEMKDGESAFGLFSLKKSRFSIPFPAGQEAAMDEYYLNIWKGSYLITLTGLDQKKETREGLKLLGDAITAKIPDTGKHPLILDKIISLFPEKPVITFIKGPLGLNNRSTFPFNPFSLSAAGVILQFPEGEILILEYASMEAGYEAWKNLQETITKKNDLIVKTGEERSWTIRDRKGKQFKLMHQGPFLYITGGTIDDKKLDSAREKLEKPLR